MSLEDDAKERLRYVRERQRRNYQLAKDLGFSSAEAAILAPRSEKRIREAAAARKAPPQETKE